MQKNPKIPRWVLRNMKLKTAREFKRQKRQELREVMKAIDKLNTGAAYIPTSRNVLGSSDFSVLREAAKRLKEVMNTKNWGN